MFRQLRRRRNSSFFLRPNRSDRSRDVLSNLGYRVVDSHNGFETIEMSTSGKIDALVLNWTAITPTSC